MSERSGGFGAFLFGIVLGAVAGFVFAPTEGGESTRRKMTKGLRNLKELAEDKVDEVRGLLKEAEDEAEENEEAEEEPELGTREQLRRRLDAARRRRPAHPRGSLRRQHSVSRRRSVVRYPPHCHSVCRARPRRRRVPRPAPAVRPPAERPRAAGALPPRGERRGDRAVRLHRARARRPRRAARTPHAPRGAPVPVVLDSYVRGTAGGPERSVRHGGEPILAEGQTDRYRYGLRRGCAVPRGCARVHEPRRLVAARLAGVQHRAVLCDLQISAEPPHLLADRRGGVAVLRDRVRARQAVVCPVCRALRDVRSRDVRCQPDRFPVVHSVDLLHVLRVPAGRRGGRDLRPDAHATPATRAPRMTPTLIDLRSDTVTKPSPGMRRAMADAEVGDDVLDGDPTTRRLEERIAELLGTGDALFFPSGTQANQTGLALVTEPGTELLLEANAHLVHSEMAGVAALSGVQIRPITTPDGLLTADLVRGALRVPSPHVPRITALAIENTNNP